MAFDKLAILRNKRRHKDQDEDESVEAIPMSQEAEDALAESEFDLHPKTAHKATVEAEKGAVVDGGTQSIIDSLNDGQGSLENSLFRGIDDTGVGGYVDDSDFLDPDIDRDRVSEPVEEDRSAALHKDPSPSQQFKDMFEQDLPDDIQDISIPSVNESVNDSVTHKATVQTEPVTSRSDLEADNEERPPREQEAVIKDPEKVSEGGAPDRKEVAKTAPKPGPKPGPKPKTTSKPGPKRATKKETKPKPENQSKKGGAGLEDKLVKALAKNLVQSAKDSAVTTNGIDFEDIEFLWDRIAACIEENL